MFEAVWQKAEKLLKKAIKKDFVLHTRMVVKAMEALIVGEGGDPTILIPAAMLHDVGWSQVSQELQQAMDPESSHEALVQHIQKAPDVIRPLLYDLGYEKQAIERIVALVVAHKFTTPTDKDMQLLIDADTLSDTYKEAFESDVVSYRSTPQKLWEFRSKNTFFTKTAREIFEKELTERKRELLFA